MSTLPRRFTRLFLRAILLAVFVALPGALLYLGLAGLPQPFIQQVARALSGSEYEVRIENIRLNLLRGFVALGIQVADSKEAPLLQVDRLAVALNLSQLLHQRIQVESLELDRANLLFPAGEGVEISVEEVSARILLPQGQLRIPRAAGVLEGVHIELEATLMDPLAFDPSTMGGGGGEATADTALRLLEILRELRFEGPPPAVRLQVSGTLADMGSISVEPFSIRLRETSWRSVPVTDLQLLGSYRSGRFTLENLTLRSEGEVLHAAGMFADRTGQAELLLRGSLPLPAIFQSLGYEKEVAEWFVPVSPRLDLHVTREAAQPASRWKALGSVDVETFRYRGVAVDFLGLDFAWEPGLFLTREARINAPAVEAVFDARVKDDIASLRVEGTFNPTLCLPWLDEGMRRVVSEMDFTDPARASVDLEIPLADSGAMSGTGFMELGRTAMRGAWIEGGTARLLLADRAVEYHDISLRMDGGSGSGVFVYDFGRREVRLRDIVSTVPPGKMLLWIDPRIASAVEPYRFRVPPDVRCEGTVDMANPEQTRLDILVRSPEGMDYSLLGRDLFFSELEGKVLVRGKKLEADVTKARLFGGDVTLQTNVSLDQKDPSYRLATTLRGVDFAAVNRLYFGYEGSDGELSADFSYTARFSRQTELEGTGWIRIENGNVFAIPVLGPISGILGSIIPGAGYQTSRLATADFTVAKETVSTKNLEIVGTGFSLFGQGDIRFVADELDMTMRLNAQGAPGLVLLPVSRFFEYAGTGPISDPRWRPRNLPREVTGEGLIETVTSPVRQLLGGENGLLLPLNGNAEDSSSSQGPARLRRKPR